MTGSVPDGEDVIQEGLFQAYRKLDTFDEGRPSKPWLFQIAHNPVYIDFLRRRGVRVVRRTQAGTRSIADVVGAALFADRHINVVPLLLGGTVGVLLQRLFAFKLHYDDVFVALGKLHLDRLRPNVLNTWIVDVLCRSYGPLDLFGRGTCLPLDGDHMNHRLGLVRRGRCETCGYNGKQ